jgi:hypothetical protein
MIGSPLPSQKDWSDFDKDGFQAIILLPASLMTRPSFLATLNSEFAHRKRPQSTFYFF